MSALKSGTEAAYATHLCQAPTAALSIYSLIGQDFKKFTAECIYVVTAGKLINSLLYRLYGTLFTLHLGSAEPKSTTPVTKRS
jgi:hypothetical protein